MVAQTIQQQSEKKKQSNNNSSSSNKVQVYVRIRPLISEEKGHKVIDYKIHNENNNKSTLRLQLPPPETREFNPALVDARAAPIPLLRSREEWKTYSGFTQVLEEDVNNEQVYQTSIFPLVQELVTVQQQQQQQPTTSTCSNPKNNSACVFTYGHTGSGKTHTLLGYNDELGMYKYAARDLLTKLQATVNPELGLMVRVTELYKDHIRDLVDHQDCSIRQDAKGHVQVRGPTVEIDNEGRLSQQSLGKFCTTPDQVIECVEAACRSRRVGTSTHHGQSSRSHLVLELEVVTQKGLDARQLLHTQEEQWTRLQWLQTERMSRRKVAPVLPKWTLLYDKSPSQLRKDIKEAEALVKESKKRLATLSQDKSLCGGTLVICDLAGNEYAQDSCSTTGSTKQELEEAAQINQSLLAVKEVIRSLNNSNNNTNSRVPYRDSKLTMVLKRHLTHKAVMLAHISPSVESLRKTINTLKYSAMVVGGSGGGTAGKKRTTTATTRKKSAGGPKPWATKQR